MIPIEPQSADSDIVSPPSATLLVREVRGTVNQAMATERRRSLFHLQYSALPLVVLLLIPRYWEFEVANRRDFDGLARSHREGIHTSVKRNSRAAPMSSLSNERRQRDTKAFTRGVQGQMEILRQNSEHSCVKVVEFAWMYLNINQSRQIMEGLWQALRVFNCRVEAKRPT